MRLFIYLALSLLVFTTYSFTSSVNEAKEMMLSKINKIRSEGCYCGRKWMEPVGPLKWNEVLEKSALSHAEDMHKNNFFAHYSKTGKDIGQRLDEFKYPWQYVGENLGEGQNNFEEVLEDWLRSRSHCRMLMNGNMKETAIVKFKNYWVQHFGSQLGK